jgi:hypothetical protein
MTAPVALYVTNAVKHLGYRPMGKKKRLPSAPLRMEGDARERAYAEPVTDLPVAGGHRRPGPGA